MKLEKFLTRPKLLKESKWYVEWPYIYDVSGGASFSPIRRNGCLHYVALAVFWVVFGFILLLPVWIVKSIIEFVAGITISQEAFTAIGVWWLILLGMLAWISDESDKKKVKNAERTFDEEDTFTPRVGRGPNRRRSAYRRRSQVRH